MSGADRAIEHARGLASQLPPPVEVRPRTQWIGIGDPQAPLEQFFAVLDHHRYLEHDGSLDAHTSFVSIGDHFDFGGPSEVDRAAADGIALLAWLAHHDQFVILAGNHDLARVGELAAFDDATWPEIRAEAIRIYNGGDVDRDAERAFLAKYPELPTAEFAARDCAAFCEAQRTLVTHLLRQHRFHLAWANHERVLFLHAGITAPQLQALGIDPQSTAFAIAAELNRQFFAAIDAWPGPPARLVIPGIHRPGDAAGGEGDGILYHRAAREPKARRFDPRELPRGLVQVIGHVRDKKSRALLGPEWCDDAEPCDGPIRHLVTDGSFVHYKHDYAHNDRELATMYFIDGGMNYCRADEYWLFDLDVSERTGVRLVR